MVVAFPVIAWRGACEARRFCQIFPRLTILTGDFEPASSFCVPSTRVEEL